MFDFAERFNKLALTDDEIALFSAVVLLSPGIYFITWFTLYLCDATNFLHLGSMQHHSVDEIDCAD